MTAFAAFPGRLPSDAELTGPMIAAGLTGLVLVLALAVGAALLVRRTGRAVARSIERGGWTGRRVLIVVAIIAALGVAGIGGARSFGAVSARFDSLLVPLVADGMIIACTSLRLAALTRGWRIPGALVTTYVFIGGTVWLNIDTATGIADALAHALAPLAYAVLVEMLAHLLRLHLKLTQPARAKLSALTWFTSPIITTRVWLHLARTGTDDPVEARALVQQVVRMASRLNSICPSHRLWPLDSARAARTAALQTIRDGLLSAAELATLLPSNRLTPGGLLALVDSAALGLTPPAGTTGEHDSAEQAAVPLWLVGMVAGALRPAPVQPDTRTETTAPVQPTGAVHGPAPVHPPHRTEAEHGSTAAAPAAARTKRSDEDDLAALRRVSDAEHGGAALSQREITRVLDCGFPKARRLAELAGWVEPAADPTSVGGDASGEIPGQLQLTDTDGDTPDETSEDSTARDENPAAEHELEMSNSR
ncbi:DUF2637 domain-containing protein [Kribbella sp. NPDC006257]|uniref:DUF2637 domain-containing protein n=1 Tax=Kribbella sp. NPDC006257 TaxID=3156738 RepID=UPI0033B9C610